ncbi:MAG: chlorite dismutase family protein [Actinobacteria bacterium]|nr:chlorite dismutase family protein [Actinomycetota bacterium]
MSAPVTPAEGLGVMHLFCRVGPLADSDAVRAVVVAAESAGDQVVPVAVLGHKADLAFMVLGDDLWRLRDLQTGLTEAGLEVVDSYVSLTEVSEYAAGIPDEMKEARLRPVLPPEGKSAWCFYPMSKRRGEQSNWFALSFDERHDLMMEHGTSGRKFAGRIVQLITASTGIDDYEWGVTLFGHRPDDIKDVVYTLRYDEASAIYAEFGPFYTGLVGSLDEVLDSVGCRAG